MIYVAIGSSLIILSILLMRLIFLKKGNPNFIYFLWFFAFARMILPFSIPINNKIDGFLNINIADGINTVLRGIYIGGVVLLVLYVISSSFYFWSYVRKLKKIGESELGVEICESDKYKCLFGILSPKILVSSRLIENDSVKKYIILHEEEHFRIKDNLWKLFRMAALIIQWYNPLAWVAFFISEEDCEVACDYRVALKLNKKEKADYTESILYALENSRRATAFTSNMSVYARMIKKRIQSVFDKKSKKEFIWIYQFVFVLTILSLLKFNVYAKGGASGDDYIASNNSQDVYTDSSSNENYIEPVIGKENSNSKKIIYSNISDIDEYKDFNLENCYIKSIKRGNNEYWIEENGTLWGKGNSEYGQLGYLDKELLYNSKPCRLAENVIHVDFSGEYFVIYLTDDNELYGLGGNVSGVLNLKDRKNKNSYNVNTQTNPVLLAKNCKYARCGYTTIIYLTENGDVWQLGNNEYIPYNNEDYFYPKKIGEDAIFVTSFFNSFAFIKSDYSLWSYGQNSITECAVFSGESYVRNPIKVYDNVSCVWMGRVGFGGDAGSLKDNHNIVFLTRDGELYGSGEGINYDNVPDSEIIEEPILSSPNNKQLTQIELRVYNSKALKNISLGSSEKELIQFLVNEGLDYYTSHTDDEEQNLCINARGDTWTFEFDSSDRLYEIKNFENDDFELGKLQVGDSFEDLLDVYGDDYSVENHDTWDRYLFDKGDYYFGIDVFHDFGIMDFFIRRKYRQ